MLDPRDLQGPDAQKALDAQGRFRMEVVTSRASSVFTAAYRMLDSFFGPRGELEPEDALGGFVDQSFIDYGSGLEGHYRLIVAWDGDTMAGVRDCYIDLDRKERRSIIALSHVYVADAYRRSGLAALFRAIPASIARGIFQERLGGPARALLSAEMEPADPEAPETIIRLIAYGRSGFGAIDPRRLPYSQPDFRDITALGFQHTAIPLVAVVRPLDEPDATSVPIEMAAAFPRFFHVCHRLYLPAWRVDPSESHALAALRSESSDCDLLPLPINAATIERLRPLLKADVLKLYPKQIRGPEQPERDPAEQWASLLSKWGPGSAK